MPDRLAVIIRFRGQPDDLFERFERVRQRWIEKQQDDYERPIFYAACKDQDGIAVVSVWPTAVAHRAFGQELHGLISDAGLPHPETIERMRTDRIGWDQPR